jgi:hypothetical protein
MKRKLILWLKKLLGITQLEQDLNKYTQEAKFLAVDLGVHDFSAICFVRKGARGQDYVEVVTMHPNIPHSEVLAEVDRMAKKWGIPRDRIYRDGFGTQTLPPQYNTDRYLPRY